MLTAAKPEEIYVEVPGRLVELKVRDSQWVKKGDLIANLSNPEKLRERGRDPGSSSRVKRS